MSEIKFQGKVAVITGAGRGLGKSYAIELAKRGAKIVVNDFGGSADGVGSDSEAADSVVKEIRDSGGEAVANYDSVATVEAGERIIQTAVDNFGTVDIVINNAGILRDRSFHKIEEEDWDILNEVHLKGAYNVTKPAIKIMRETGYGRIIFTTSGTALYGNFGQANYAAAKMGLIGLMNVLKIETGKYDITCNTIAPVADTRLTKGLLTPEIAELYNPNHVMALVLYLVSQDNQESGSIYNCAAGWYSKSQLVCAPGVLLGNGKEEITVEDVKNNWDKINNMEDAKFLNNLAESFQFLEPNMPKK